MKNIFWVVFIFLLFSISTNVLAQTNNTEPVSCFDYYKFGSVHASLETKNYKNTSGTTAHFFGEIKNDNNYPIVDGKLFVKVMRANDSYEKTGGQDEIDSFVVKEGISIPANASIPIDFDWKIPGYAISGEYQVSTYFSVDNSFNMSGLPFTTDIVGGVVKFAVVGEQKEGLIFDRTSIALNDNVYYTVAFPPVLSATTTANISLTLTNSTSQTQRVPVTLELYEWDGQAQKNLLDTKEITYLIDANSSIQIPYTVTDTKHSVYYLLAKAKYKDAKSEVSVRFAREGIPEPRINFSTFIQYPFVKGQENSLITCVHNTSNLDAEYGKVVTSVLDHAGNIIHTSTYEGKITSAIQGMISKFIPQANYKDLKIETKIYDKNNNIIDETSVDYVCSSLSDDCKEPNLFFSMSTLITLLAIILIVALIILLKKHLKKKDLIVMFALPFLLGCLVMPGVGEAKSVTWSSGTAIELSSLDYMNWYDGTESNSGSQVSGITSQITFHANVKNLTTGQFLSENSVVKSGDTLRFIFGNSDTNFSQDYKDIFWFGAGATWDSPYGDWVDNALTTLIPNKEKYFLSQYVDGNAIDAHVFGQFAVNPPIKKIISTDNLNCGNIDQTKHYIDCVVNPVESETVITPNFVYEKTYGRYYFMNVIIDPASLNIGGHTSYVDIYNTTATGADVFVCLNYNCTSHTYVFKTWDQIFAGSFLRFTGDDISTLAKFKYYYTAANHPNKFLASPSGDGSDYIINIATTTISYPLTVQPSVLCTPSNTPVKPGINIPTTATTGSYTFSITPNNASTTYAIDWGEGAEWETVLNPNSVPKTWTTIGTKTVKVKATDTTSLCSIESDVKTIVISNPVGPTEPFNLNASASCDNVSLNWNDNGADSYEVYRQSSIDPIPTKISPTLGSGTITYPDNSVISGVTYTYQIFSIKNGIEVPSDIKSVTPTCPTCNLATKPQAIPDNPPVCYQILCDITQNPPKWEQTSSTCSVPEGDITFDFSPNVADSNNKCPLTLTISNVASCFLKNRSLIQVGDIIPAAGDSIIISAGSTYKYGIGTYTLWCSTLTDPINYNQIPVGDRSCYSNPKIKEN